VTPRLRSVSEFISIIIDSLNDKFQHTSLLKIKFRKSFKIELYYNNYNFWRKVLKTVLLVDDSLTIVKMLSHFLSSLGLAVDFTTEPKEGFEKIKKRSYDLLILDLEMPDMNGVQFLNQMKQSSINIPTMVLTGKKDDRLIFGIMSQFSHVKKYEIKPYNKDNIEKSVKDILKIEIKF